jgi:hypothetical protein
MHLHIEPTDRVVELVNGDAVMPARVWEGQTDNGIPVICWITRVAAERARDLSELDAALAEQRPPSAGALEFPRRMIL